MRIAPERVRAGWLQSPADPEHANADCGVAWLDHPEPALVSSFAQGIEKVRVPETENQVLGDYYSTGRYMTRADFEARGCPGTGSPGGAFVDG